MCIAGTTPPKPVFALLLVLALALLSNVSFHAGAALTKPTQLAFVPMLFVLPLPWVPLLAAVGFLVGSAPALVRARLRIDRVAAALADSWYAIGPVAVLWAAGIDHLDLSDWPILLLALAAQLVLGTVTWLARSWYGLGIPPRTQLQPLLWVALVDAVLAPVGLVGVLAGEQESGAFLLLIPLAVLMTVFAHERNARMSQALELSTAYRGTAALLGDLLEHTDHYTGGLHTHGVVELSVAVADELRLPAAARRRVELAALLHDIGKISVPEAILNKPGKLTDEEWQIMRQHTVTGQAMLDRVGGALAEVGWIVRASHERWDGRGYPDGLAGHEIPREAAIVCACDAYDAMTTDRVYRRGRSTADALEELDRCAGMQFDPEVVAALLRALRSGRVRLRASADEPGE